MGEHSIQSIPFRLAGRGRDAKMIIKMIILQLLLLYDALNDDVKLLMVIDECIDRQLTPDRVSGGPWKSPLTSCRAKHLQTRSTRPRATPKTTSSKFSAASFLTRA